MAAASRPQTITNALRILNVSSCPLFPQKRTSQKRDAPRGRNNPATTCSRQGDIVGIAHRLARRDPTLGLTQCGMLCSRHPIRGEQKWPKRKRRNQPVTYTWLLTSSCSSSIQRQERLCQKSPSL